MVLGFKDFYSSFIKDAKVLIILGEHEIFKNKLSDMYFKANQSIIDYFETEENDLLNEFGLKEDIKTTDTSSQNKIYDVFDFIDKARYPSLLGKWKAQFSIDDVSEKELKALLSYAKKPADHGLLVLTSRNFKKQLLFLREKSFESSRQTHLFKLQFPTKKFMKQFIWKMSEERQIRIDDKALDLLFHRMGNNYDGYQEILDQLSVNYKKSSVTYDNMVKELKGVDYYNIDNFLLRLLTVKETKAKKITKNKTIYKMLNSLIENEKATDIVKKLKYKLEDCIKLRLIVNQGLIPVGVAYSVADVKEKLGEEGDPKLLKLSEFQFKRLATIASMTTLNDFYIMRSIIEMASSRKFLTEDEARLVLLRLIERAQYSKDQLLVISRLKEKE